MSGHTSKHPDVARPGISRRQMLGSISAGAAAIPAMTTAIAEPAPHCNSDEPACIDEALMGMGIEDAAEDAGACTVTTPGAAITLDRDGVLRVRQRIGSERELLTLRLDGHFAPWCIGVRTPFRCRLDGNGMRISIQGDSVLVFEPRQNVRLAFEGHLKPAYNRHLRGNRMLLDDMGGCAFFGIPPRPTELEEQGDSWMCRCHLARWDELWVSICPPRKEDPRRMSQSISHDIMYYLLQEDPTLERYPSRATLEEIAKHCQILALHEEIWQDAPPWVDDPPGADYPHPKPWETNQHIPFHEGDFARMRQHARRLGLKMAPYCSPYYCNAPDLFAEMKRVLNEYEMDGLYFDGWCSMRDDFRPGYHLMRRARKILGDRILYMHSSTDPFGSVDVYPPFAFTYADFCLRGESGRGDSELDAFLRYTISGRQISNSVGMWCYYGSMGKSGYHFVVPSSEDIQAAVKTGARIWRQSRMWKKHPRELDRFDREYYAAIAPNT